MFGVSDSGWVAIGTLVLACGTFGLAAVSAFGVKATFTDVSASLRPILVDVPVGLSIQDAGLTGVPPGSPGGGASDPWDIVLSSETGHVSVPLRNVGPGVAWVVWVRFDAVGGDDWTKGWPTAFGLPPGEVVRANGTLPASTTRAFLVSVAYNDITPHGRNWLTTLFVLRDRTTGEWNVESIELVDRSGAWRSATWHTRPKSEETA
jgi:hypothetical protein